jgi:HEAT repeats
MRVYQRVLLVAVLSVGLFAAGVAWVRCYVSPLAAQAEFKPDTREDIDELPADCLEEMLSTGQPSRVAATPPSSAAVSGGPSLTVDENPLRPGDGNQKALHIEVADSAPGRLENNAAARPIYHAQSAEYVEANSAKGRRQTGPGVAENALQSKDVPDALRSAGLLDLMRRLRADDSVERAMARQELVRRRFSEVDLELAKQLFSPDVEARKQLARELPRLSSVDEAQWLMWLAQDPQPEVRSLAISTLATTRDPALLDRLEALAGRDPDPQIKSLAEQIRKQHDLEFNRGGPVNQ